MTYAGEDKLAAAFTTYEQGKYKIALEQFTQLALQENADAQYHLAFMYFGGEGTERNDVKAAYWFEKAAKLAHSGAQDKLAYLYLNGRGVEKNHIQAYAWYRIAAENGIFLAQNISENIKNNLTVEEQIQADFLSAEYLDKYRKNIH